LYNKDISYVSPIFIGDFTMGNISVTILPPVERSGASGKIYENVRPTRIELLTLPEHLSSHAVFSEDCVTRTLVLFVCFVGRCLSLCSLSLGHYVV
jgi:hypothetical protein